MAEFVVMINEARALTGRKSLEKMSALRKASKSDTLFRVALIPIICVGAREKEIRLTQVFYSAF